MHLEFPFLTNFLHQSCCQQNSCCHCFPIINLDSFLVSIVFEMLWWGWYAWGHVGKREKKMVCDSQGCFAWDGCLYTMKFEGFHMKTLQQVARCGLLFYFCGRHDFLQAIFSSPIPQEPIHSSKMVDVRNANLTNPNSHQTIQPMRTITKIIHTSFMCTLSSSHP